MPSLIGIDQMITLFNIYQSFNQNPPSAKTALNARPMTLKSTAPTKTPAEERDWSQSALLRLIQEEATYNVPMSVPHQPVQAEPRPAASPPKNVMPPPEPTPPLAEPQEVVPDIPNTFQFQNAMPMTGVSDF